MKFAKDDWIVTDKGIGQLVSAQRLYIEEFHVQSSDSKRVGDIDFENGVFKVFCNFQGIPKKRLSIDSCNLKYCTALSEEYQEILSSALNSNPESYEKFKSFSSKKEIGDWCNYWVQVPIVEASATCKTLEELNKEINKPFQFTECLNMLKDIGLDLEYTYGDKEKTFIGISMFNKDWEVKNKRRLFTKVNTVLKAD